MRRILCIVVAALLTVCFSGCRKTKVDNAADSADWNSSWSESNGEGSTAEENPGLNLFSTSERPVIQTDFGYYIFQFNGNKLSQLEVVYDEETDEGAQTLYNTMTAPGYNQKDFVHVSLYGRYVVGIAAEDSMRYGYLFRMQKLDILSSFYNNKKNAES
ncbi:MAG: hypothetical protein HFE66_07935 [Clostridiales bacterium]|jgi:hypothetical protein|nr:hypothetical protein [Clostridiales bacterium]